MQRDALIADAAARAIVDIVATVDGFRPPAQRRTLRRTASILTAATRLLMERPYAQVSLDDIAKSAECSIASIYARFADKETIIPAIHLLLMESYRPVLTEELSIDRFRGASLDEFAVCYTSIMHRYHLNYQMALRSCISVNSELIHAQVRDIMNDYTARLNSVVHVLMGRSAEETSASVQYAIRLILAVYRDAISAGDIFPFPNAKSTARIFAAVIRENITESPG